MHGLGKTMKLKVRVAILACTVVSFCAIFVAVNQLPTLHDGKLAIFNSNTYKRTFEEPVDLPHIFTFRKRLNKSNYSSDDISPEMGKRAMENKASANETSEDIKDPSDSNNQENRENPNYEPSNKSKTNMKKNDDLSSPFNETDEFVDKLLNFLQSSNGLKFNFEKTKLVPYVNFIKLQSKRIRRKGHGLPIYINYHGG